MFLGQKNKRKESNDYVIFEQKSNFYWEEYFFILLERKIIKKYFLSFVYFIYYLKNIFFNFYILFFIYTFSYLFFDLKILNFIIYVFIYLFFFKIIIHIWNILYFFLFLILKKLMGKLLLKDEILKFYFLMLIKKINYSIFFIIYLFKFLILTYLLNYIFKLLWKNLIKFLLFLKNKFFKIFILFLFIYEILILYIYICFVYLVFLIFFNVKFKNFLNYFYRINFFIFFKILFFSKKNSILKKIKKILNIEFFFKNTLKFSINFIWFLNFLFELLFFFNKTKIFIDRYTFYIWDDVRDEDYEYTYWTVNYKYIKYYADRKYFGLSGYLWWKYHILKYEVLIPLSYVLHKWEWQMELREIQTFTLWEYTEIEKTFVLFYKYFSYYFLREYSFINRRNLFFDFYYFFWFFIFEDLILYYFQINILFIYNFKYNNIILLKIKNKIINFFINFQFIVFNLYYKYYRKWLKIIKLLIFHKIIYLFLNLLKIYIFFYFLKIKKNIKNILKVQKFIISLYIDKKLNKLYKIQLFSFFYLLKFICYFFLKNKHSFNYFFDNKIKIKKIYFLKKNKSLKLRDVVFKNYKNEQYYLFFKRFFLFKNMLNFLIIMEEKKNLYNILKTVLSYYKNLKSIDKLTWLDRLTGGDAGYVRTYKLYLNYLDIKRKQRKKKINKFKFKKNYYYYYIKKNK